MVEIELDIFDGRPNPSWRLNDDEARVLMALTDGLPPAERPPDAPMGYRGFVIKRADAAGLTSAPLRVFAGTVACNSEHHRDTRGAEAWLMRNARQHGCSALLDGIPCP